MGNRMTAMKENVTMKMPQGGVKLVGVQQKRDLRGTTMPMKIRCMTAAHGDRFPTIKATTIGVQIAHMCPHGESHQIDPRPAVTMALTSRAPRGTITAVSTKDTKMIHGRRAMTRKMSTPDGTRAAMHLRTEDREVQDPQNTGIKSMMTEQENGATTAIESKMTGTRIPVTVEKIVLGVKKAMGIKITTGGIAGVTIETAEAHHTEIRKRPHKAGAQVHHQSPNPEVLRNRRKSWSGEVILVVSTGRDLSKRFF